MDFWRIAAVSTAVCATVAAAVTANAAPVGGLRAAYLAAQRELPPAQPLLAALMRERAVVLYFPDDASDGVIELRTRVLAEDFGIDPAYVLVRKLQDATGVALSKLAADEAEELRKASGVGDEARSILAVADGVPSETLEAIAAQANDLVENRRLERLIDLRLGASDEPALSPESLRSGAAPEAAQRALVRWVIQTVYGYQPDGAAGAQYSPPDVLAR